MPKVYVTRPILEDGIKLLKEKGFQVEVNPEDRVLSKDELKKAVTGVDALLCLLTDKIDSELLDAAGLQLKIVANYAVGFDNIDVEEAKKRNVMVSNTPGVLTEAVAEHTFALLIAVAKHIVEADKFLREGKYRQWDPKGFLGPELQGKTLGILGLGRIGSRVVEIGFKGFGMKVIYYDVKQSPDFEKQVSAKFESVDEVLKQSDFVSVHVPLLPTTRHLISAKQFGLMKPTAILINTSRGPVVDEIALVEALKSKKIAGAGIDVFEHEPDLTPGLADLPNLIMTPHTASATFEARSAMSSLAAENIMAAFEGKPPPNLVK